MENRPRQRFCTTCGQPLASGAAFCVACGTPVSAPPTSVPGQFPAGTPSNYAPPNAQASMQEQDDPLLAALVADSVANRMGRNPRQRGNRGTRRPGSRLRGCGCLLLILALLTGPFLGVALTKGMPHLIFAYVAGSMIVLFCLVLLIGMLATRRGREALSEGCLEAILTGFLGG